LLERPSRGKKWGALAWHFATPYFVKAMKDVRRRLTKSSRSPACQKPMVKTPAGVLSADRGGDPNYNIHRWLEAEGAEVYPAAITGLVRLPDAPGGAGFRGPHRHRPAARA